MQKSPWPDQSAGSLLLAIDSSSEQAGLAIFDGARCTELNWPAGRSQTTTLLAEIQRLLALNQIEPVALAAIAVTTGPGTFNGLRVGISIAKGLVLGLGLPLIGVATLAAAALPFAELGRTVVPLVPAGRGRIVWATYAGDGSTWREATPPRNGTLDQLIASLPEASPAIITGELNPDQAATLSMLDAVWLPPPALRTRRPAAVATLAWDRWQRGDTDDPASLQPVYAGRDQISGRG